MIQRNQHLLSSYPLISVGVVPPIGYGHRNKMKQLR